MKPSYFKMDVTKKTLYCHGKWTLRHVMALKKALQALEMLSHISFVDGQHILKMDTAGALVLQQINTSAELVNFNSQHLKLLKLVSRPDDKWLNLPTIDEPNFFARVGISTIKKITEFVLFLNFIGELTLLSLKLLTNIKRIPWRSIISTVEVTGIYAMPIIALLSFLIGVVLTYQMGLQLKNYGANIYIVDLLGLSILREFAPLMTAIIVAGRSGSAFTAQLGTMKIREELDALQTMGLSPSELLIIPKLVGMFFVLPLLTIWSSIFAIFGGMIVSNHMLNITYADFLHRFYEVIQVKSYFTGMIKSPVFGLTIASIGCFQGMQVFGSATSVGDKTTTSVVQSIFFIIVIDAIFSIIFSWLNI